nr:hypothetical protein [Tanacetum cinerariifolium]
MPSRAKSELLSKGRQDTTTTEVILETGLEKEVAAKRRKRGNDKAKANASPKLLRKDHAAFRPAQSTLGWKSLAPIGLDAGSTFSMPATQDAPTTAKSVSDPYSLSYAKLQPHPESFRKTGTEIPTENVATTEKATAKIARQESKRGGRDKKLDEEIKSLRAVEAKVHVLHNQKKNLETLLKAEVDMKKAAEAKNAKLAKELE